MSTLTELVTRTADRLSMVAGTGVQVYAEDRIAEMIQHKFDVLFDEAFWPQFLTWDILTLDGTLGIVTKDLTNFIKRYEDIRVIFPQNSSTPLTKMSALTTNPFELSGTVPIHYESLLTEYFRFGLRQLQILLLYNTELSLILLSVQMRLILMIKH